MFNSSVTVFNLLMNVDGRAGEGELATIQEGREFHNAKPPAGTCSPFVYPHPLQSTAAKIENQTPGK